MISSSLLQEMEQVLIFQFITNLLNCAVQLYCIHSDLACLDDAKLCG